MKTILTLLLITCTFINSSFCQNSGKGFSFQSLIRDKDGGILKAKNVQMYIRFYGEGTSTTLFEETHLTTTDDFGAIGLSIGSGQKVSGSLSKFSDLNFGSSNIWYAISILDGGTKREIANQKFLSVPYAEFAFNASPVPSGTILPFAGEVVPTGYLACDGAEYSKSQYPLLFNAIQNIWGTSSNNNNFRVPDFRGLFLRGVDGSANRDPDKTTRTALRAGQNSGNKVGSYQNDEIKSHTHENMATTDGVKAPFGGGGGWEQGTYDPAWAYSRLKYNTNTGGSESRPKNVYVLYIIKI